jgi:hypothetical protein
MLMILLKILLGPTVDPQYYKDYYSQMGFTEDWLEENGIVLIYIPYTNKISSSKIKERIFKNAKT